MPGKESCFKELILEDAKDMLISKLNTKSIGETPWTPLVNVTLHDTSAPEMPVPEESDSLPIMSRMIFVSISVSVPWGLEGGRLADLWKACEAHGLRFVMKPEGAYHNRIRVYGYFDSVRAKKETFPECPPLPKPALTEQEKKIMRSNVLMIGRGTKRDSKNGPRRVRVATPGEIKNFSASLDEKRKRLNVSPGESVTILPSGKVVKVTKGREKK